MKNSKEIISNESTDEIIIKKIKLKKSIKNNNNFLKENKIKNLKEDILNENNNKELIYIQSEEESSFIDFNIILNNEYKEESNIINKEEVYYLENKKETKDLKNKFFNLPIFSKKYIFIYNFIIILPFLFFGNTIIFSQLCILSTLYKHESKNYLFVGASIITIFFSKKKKVIIDNYDDFFNDCELNMENINKTSKNKVYKLSKWDYNHLPKNTSLENPEIKEKDPIIDELTIKLKNFNFHKNKHITINGQLYKWIFLIKEKGNIINPLETLNNNNIIIDKNIKEGIEDTSKLVPVIIAINNFLFLIYNKNYIKIDRQFKAKQQLLIILLPDDLVDYLDRIALSQNPIAMNSINRYINYYLLNEFSIYIPNY